MHNAHQNVITDKHDIAEVSIGTNKLCSSYLVTYIDGDSEDVTHVDTDNKYVISDLDEGATPEVYINRYSNSSDPFSAEIHLPKGTLLTDSSVYRS